jgi:hypothetical protein
MLCAACFEKEHGLHVRVGGKMNLYQIAQQVTDEFLGKGAYVELNKFDPSKGETHAFGKDPKPNKPPAKKKRKK